MSRPWSKGACILKGFASLVVPASIVLGNWYGGAVFRVVKGAVYVKPFVHLEFLPLPIPNLLKWYAIRTDSAAPVATESRSLFGPHFSFMLREPQNGLLDFWIRPWAPKRFLRALRSAGFEVVDAYGVEGRSTLTMLLSLWWPVLVSLGAFILLLRLVVFPH